MPYGTKVFCRLFQGRPRILVFSLLAYDPYNLTLHPGLCPADLLGNTRLSEDPACSVHRPILSNPNLLVRENISFFLPAGNWMKLLFVYMNIDDTRNWNHGFGPSMLTSFAP